MSEVSIKKYETLSQTVVIACDCATYASMPKQKMHSTTPSIARRWSNKKFCTQCGKKFLLVDVDVVLVDVGHIKDGLFSKKASVEQYVCLVDQKQPWCQPLGSAHSADSDEKNSDFEKDIGKAVRDYLNGGALLE